VKPTIESAVKIIEDALKSNKGHGLFCRRVPLTYNRRCVSYETSEYVPQNGVGSGFADTTTGIAQSGIYRAMERYGNGKQMELYNLVSTLDDVDKLPRREVDRIVLFNQVDKPCESSSADLLGESQRVKAMPIQPYREHHCIRGLHVLSGRVIRRVFTFCKFVFVTSWSEVRSKRHIHRCRGNLCLGIVKLSKGATRRWYRQNRGEYKPNRNVKV
jgi:hypothetical protein